MQGVSVSSLAALASGGSCRAVSLFKDYLKLLNRSGINPMVDGSCFGRQCMLRLYSINTNRARRLDSRIGATWLFSGGGKKMDASIERSEATNEEIVVFFFQLDLETRIQYALNTEQFDVAQQLRNKLNEQEAKRGSSRSEAQDKALNLLRLRADLQKAIDNEKYVVAAKLRDEISKLEVESLAASAKALAYENAQYAYRLGEKVRHKIFGYRAVICGMDPICCESSSWMGIANVEKLSQGPNQPFYQVLVDVHDDPNLLVAYVAEENLSATEKPDLTRFDHPYVSFLFYGTDTTGDFIPIKQLREKFSRPRHEVPSMDTQDGNEDDNI
ncbi:clp protease adapter protein ClpF, chloroplastic isoform X3 [Dendrobium catenatum]|uniref:clp protease adapter protein ClpF, chloroplastic isoform X3 n=1 Tax=Dendrobium catenatum TaxID=906689 RepID=UPI0010A00E51|nr:clp protease adapter protein ClpF, chloroplastic isoform X3 [Dendrobium catenatum]